MWVHQRPRCIGLHPSHKKIRNPQGIKQIPGPQILHAGLKFQVQKVENVAVPRFQVDGKRARALITALVDVLGGGVVHFEHGDQSVGRPVGTGNVRPGAANGVDVQPDAAGVFAYGCAFPQGRIDARNGILITVHGQQKTRRHLRKRCARVEHGGRGMAHVPFGQQGIRFQGSVDIIAVDAKRDAQIHVLRAFDNFAMHL